MPRKARYEDLHEAPHGAIASAAGVLARRPFDAFAGALAAACTAMILVNALVLQDGLEIPPPGPRVAREAPAPVAAAPRAEEPKRDELVEQVQTALAERDLYDGVVDGLMGSATASAIRSFQQSQGVAPTGEASEKVLGMLLTAPMPKPGAPALSRAPQAATKPTTPATTASTVQPDAKLMAAQKALAKIGYGPVLIDGKMGAGTRNAIKSFERDHGMTETGELSPQVLRALQGMTGAPLQ